MDNYPPQIEIINEFPDDRPLPKLKPEPWFRSRRFIIFMTAYLISTAIGLTYNYSRPAIFQSSATLLTSAMTAIDQVSADADIQHVAIQRQILLGQELLDESLDRIRTTHPQFQLSMGDIRQMLQVKPVAETNLVEMQAEGPQPEILPVLINTWIDVYLDARAADIARNKGATIQIVQNELHDQELKIEAAREALNEFRARHDITSTQREENAALARLKGLTTALNNASEEEVKTKARLDAVNKAIANGQAVVPTQDQPSLAELENRLQNLKEKLAEFDRRFTREYMALQPSLKYIPQEIIKLEREIEQKRKYGKKIVLTDAEQNYEAAKQSVRQLRQQLEEHKQLAAEFSARFAEHEALETDLEGLEKIYRETQERLVLIETQNVDKYPQVKVIERAYLPLASIRPHYGRDTLIVLTGAIGFALLCVWISEYLTREHKQQPGLTLSGIHVYKDIGFDKLSPPEQPDSSRLPQDGNKKLASPIIRELSDAEIRALFSAADTMGRQLIGLLLSGLTLEETAILSSQNFDLDQNRIRIQGPGARVITINDALKSLFAATDDLPAWRSNAPFSVDDMSAMVRLTAIDAGLPHPEEISAEAIRHTYIVYLVRQGLRLSELSRVVGYLPPTDKLSYGNYSPPRPGSNLEEIELIHPVLAGPVIATRE
ncbi:MAG: GumC family protein [Gammaproteobacteria bacterium]